MQTIIFFDFDNGGGVESKNNFLNIMILIKPLDIRSLTNPKRETLSRSREPPQSRKSFYWKVLGKQLVCRFGKLFQSGDGPSLMLRYIFWCEQAWSKMRRETNSIAWRLCLLLQVLRGALCFVVLRGASWCLALRKNQESVPCRNLTKWPKSCLGTWRRAKRAVKMRFQRF